MMIRLRALAALAVLSWPAVGASAAAPPASAPQRLVIVMRHGVRAPSEPPAALAIHSAEAWPAWPVAPGELTPHGAAALRLLAAWMRQHEAASGVWPPQGCPAANTIFVYADGKDHRTVDSGEAFLDGAFPGCVLHARHGPAGQSDPLFRAADANVCPIDQSAARTSILASLPGGLAQPWPGYRASLAALDQLLNGSSRPDCARQPGRCLQAGQNTLDQSRKGLRLNGPLATAASLTESLNLEYLEGLSGAALGWGRLQPNALPALLALHNEASAMMRADPVIAGHNGGLLARAVLDALSGQAGLPDQHGQASPVTLLMGHDTNVANLAGILGVTWRLPDEADQTPPGGALIFRLRPGQAGQAPTVAISMLAQTALQIRALRPLTGSEQPTEIALAVPACAGSPAGLCTLPQLRAAIEARVPASCKSP